MRTTRLLSMLVEQHLRPPIKVRHYEGFPPELAGGRDTNKEMAAAVFLVIEELASGIFLNRYDGQGNSVGDTWHMSVDEARDQAAYEYEDAVGDWSEVPEDVDDVVNFGVSRFRDALGG